MAVISTGNHPKALWPGVHAWVGQKYREKPMQYTSIFDVRSSEKAYEETVEATGFGMAPVKAQGAALTFDTHSQGPTTRYTHVVYGLGYIVTEEELEDNLYKSRAFDRGRMLAFSFRQTEEVVHAATLNNAFDSAYAGGDGKELCATDHPVYGGGTQSNELAVAADLSESALEDALILIRSMQNNRNLKINLMGERLIVAPANEFEAERIVNSSLRPGTANNDVNAMRSLGKLPKGVMVYDYLTDDDAWFVQTDCPDGLISFNRRAFRFQRDNDFDTKKAKASGTRRFSQGWSDFRCIVGSPGA